jgi:hypothetical protein
MPQQASHPHAMVPLPSREGVRLPRARDVLHVILSEAKDLDGRSDDRRQQRKAQDDGEEKHAVEAFSFLLWLSLLTPNAGASVEILRYSSFRSE